MLQKEKSMKQEMVAATRQLRKEKEREIEAVRKQMEELLKAKADNYTQVRLAVLSKRHQPIAPDQNINGEAKMRN